jgi:peptide/nickel transport system permease protein
MNPRQRTATERPPNATGVSAGAEPGRISLRPPSVQAGLKDPATITLSAGRVQAPREWVQLVRRLARRRTALFGLVVGMVVVVAALGAPWLAVHDPTEQDITNRLKPPGFQSPSGRAHLLGTDHLGRDILARVLFGARPALMVGFAAVAISGLLGMMVGLLSGYFGGRVDDVFMRLADVQLAFPFILLAIAVIGVLGPSLPVIIVVIGVSSWVVYARVVRGAVLSLREREFVQAAHALGSRDGRVLLRHILPNAFTPWLVVATLDMARVIVIESALSFLGLGVQPPTPTWGGMLADGRVYISTAWWLATFPGLAILLTVLGINLFGDGLRDTLDPRLRI